MVLAAHLHAGVDYSLTDEILVGLKLTYSMMGNVEDSSGYSLHPLHGQDPDFPNTTGPEISGQSYNTGSLPHVEYNRSLHDASQAHMVSPTSRNSRRAPRHGRDPPGPHLDRQAVETLLGVGWRRARQLIP